MVKSIMPKPRRTTTCIHCHEANWSPRRGGTTFVCLTCIREKMGAYRHKLRKDALTLLGDKCVICGFNDARALQIDHINGGGAKENRELRTQGIYRRVLTGVAGYQLLCANCNWIKRSENNEAVGGPLGWRKATVSPEGKEYVG